jgi:hypothetical protein
MDLDNNKPDPGGNANISDPGDDVSIFTPLFDAQLNQIDRFANLLFLLGISNGFTAINKVDESIFLKQENELSEREELAYSYEIAQTLSTANWIYLTAGSLFFETSFDRLKQKEALMPEDPSLTDIETLSGRKMITMGNLLKIIGYMLSATGFEMIASGAKRDLEALDSPENQ